jgi:hypothetical protein
VFFGLARHEDAVAQLDALVAAGLPIELVENIEFTRLFFAVAAEPLPGVRALVSEMAHGSS